MIKPLGNRIFIKKDQQPDKKGSILLIKQDGMYAPPYSGLITGVGDGVEDSDGNEISLTIKPQMFRGYNIDSNKEAMKDFITRVTDLNLEDFTGSISNKQSTPSSTPKKKTPISI